MKLQKNTKKHKKVVITALEQRTLITEHATKPELFFFNAKSTDLRKNVSCLTCLKKRKNLVFFRQVEMPNRCNLYQNEPLFFAVLKEGKLSHLQ